MRSAVKNAAKHFPTAIISGRRRDMVYELVGLTELYYAGSHGMDIKFPLRGTAAVSVDHLKSEKLTDQQDKEFYLFQPAREYFPMIEEVYRTLVDITKDINGAKVENHKFCALVHYRNVDEKSWGTIAQLVHDVLKDYPRLRLTHGRKVLEVRPMIDWNKGKAVEFLLESMTLICMMGTVQRIILTIVVEKENTAIWAIYWDTKFQAALYGGIVCAGAGYYISGVIMRQRGPVFVTSFSPLSMVIVAILGPFLLSEQLVLGRVIGAIIIVIGLYLVLWGKSKDQCSSESDLLAI